MILWSGGADSTLILCDELVKHGRAKTLSIVHNYCDVDRKRELESMARQRILAALRNRGFQIQHAEIHVQLSGDYGIAGHDGLPQPVIWMTQALCCLDSEDTFLQVGYIRGDDFWHYRQVYVEAFNRLKSMLYFKAELDFPLEWESKKNVLERLKKHRVASKVWYCQSPTKSGRVCKTCPPCRTHRFAKMI